MFSRARLRLKRAPLLGEGGGFPLLEEEELEVLLRPTPTRRELTMRRGCWTCESERGVQELVGRVRKAAREGRGGDGGG